MRHFYSSVITLASARDEVAGGGDAETMETEGRKRYRTRDHNTTTASPDLLLNWGNRKRLRCIKLQSKDDANDASAGVKPETVAAAKTCRAERRSTRSEKETGKCVLRRVASPTRQRVLRNSEAAGMAAKGNEGSRGAAVKSPERGKAGVGAAASEEKKSGAAGGSSSGSEGTVWPKFEMALTTKEKEEDFLVFKGSKLPQRPKKRAKIIQKTINLVSPGAWLCDLTLERYEVREKKISKKKPRGLKAMGNMESDSE